MSSLALYVLIAAGIGLADFLLRRFGPRGARITSRAHAVELFLDEFPEAGRDGVLRTAVSGDGKHAFLALGSGSVGLVRMLGEFPVVRVLGRDDVAWARPSGEAGLEAKLSDLTIRRLKATLGDPTERDAVLGMLRQ